MDLASATKLLEYLADGVDPFTGEKLPKDCICNQGDVVRAFHCILQELDKVQKKKKRPLPENAGKPWSQEDEQRLLLLFESGSSIQQLTTYFKRTRGSIIARLTQLGKWDLDGGA